MTVVWILGAGFSRSLGGPLLNDLFAEWRCDAARARFPALDRVTELTSVFDLIRPRTQRGRNYVWTDNPEILLEYLDIANDSEATPATRTAARAAVGPVPGRPLQDDTRFRELSRAARSYLAAACSAFVDDLETARSAERWDPYRRFVTQLDAKATIITFNYDRVVETAFATHKSSDLEVAIPTAHQPRNAEAPGPRLLKLHGSVDWARADRSSIAVADFTNTLASGAVPEIVGPGPGKARAADGDFRPLWREAAAALRVAEAIVFLGYRFPETDAMAKRSLLGAIGENVSQDLALHLVLGADDRSATRLEGLLHWSLRARSPQLVRIGGGRAANTGRGPLITRQPMNVEDFLTVFDRDALVRGDAG